MSKQTVATQELPAELAAFLSDRLVPFVRALAADIANPAHVMAAGLVADYDRLLLRILTDLGGDAEIVEGHGVVFHGRAAGPALEAEG